MDPLIGGALISGASSLLGGLFGSNSQERANKRNIELQREFAQNGIQWKVADARRAGIHPVVALGAQTASFSPSVVGDTSFGTGVAQAGQDIGRAIQATRSPEQRVDAYSKTVQDLSLQRMGLENSILAAQLAKVSQPATGPAMPSATQSYLVDGQGQTALPPDRRAPAALVSDQPMERSGFDITRPFAEPAPINDLGHARSSSGYVPIPSSDMKQRIDDDQIGTLIWNLRNRVLPSFQQGMNPPYNPPGGHYWWYNPVKQEYQLRQKIRQTRGGGSGW